MGNIMEKISSDRIRLNVDEARALAVDTLERIGYDQEQAGVIAEHVLDAALCDYEYSGLPKLLNVAEHKQLRNPRRRLHPLHEQPVTA